MKALILRLLLGSADGITTHLIALLGARRKAYAANRKLARHKARAAKAQAARNVAQTAYHWALAAVQKNYRLEFDDTK